MDPTWAFTLRRRRRTVTGENGLSSAASPLAAAADGRHGPVIESRPSVLTQQDRRREVLRLILSVAVAALAAAPAFAADLTVVFPDAAAEGRIMVAVFDSAEAYQAGRPVKAAQLDAAAGETRITFDDLPDGDYAVRAFHDLNADGRMNTNPFGMPTEPSPSPTMRSAIWPGLLGPRPLPGGRVGRTDDYAEIDPAADLPFSTSRA